MQQMTTSSFFILLTLFVSILSCSSISRPEPPTEDGVYLVYTNQPESDDPTAFSIKTLTAVLGSEKAAKEALLYSYKYAFSGFAAKLTPDQAKNVTKQPGVVHVTLSRTFQLDTKPGKPSF